MTQDFLEYPKLMERAVRGVVREALSLVAQHGLPGLHHFYISFRTRAPGVSMPDHLLRQYPEEMTIVLEHQFWDLDVTEDAFAVSLSFSGTQERLVIPFDAITGFVDPSVKFGLQFGAAKAEGVGGPVSMAPQDEVPAPIEPKAPPPAPMSPSESETGDDRVIALDQFRKK